MFNSPLCVSCSGVSSSSCLVCVPGGGCSPGLKAGDGGDRSCRAPGSGHWGPWQAFSCARALPGCLWTPGVSVSCSSVEKRQRRKAYIRAKTNILSPPLVMCFTACISCAAALVGFHNYMVCLQSNQCFIKFLYLFITIALKKAEYPLIKVCFDR